MLMSIADVERMEHTRDPAQRAALLVLISGPYHDRARRKLQRIPLGNLVLTGTVSSLYVAMTTGPFAMVRRMVDSGVAGPAAAGDRQRAVLVGNLATVLAGVVAQRAVNHSGLRGPAAEVGRVLGSQLAIGGAASALVVGTEMLRGAHPEDGKPPEPSPFAVVALTTLTQRKALRRLARVVTLPGPARSVRIPVKNGRRVSEVELRLMA